MMAAIRAEVLEPLDIDRIRQLERRAQVRDRVGPIPWAEPPALSPKPQQVVAWLRRHVPGFRILGWHRQVIGALYGDPAPSQVIASLPRGNGKTTLAAALSVYELLGRGLRRAQILMLATNENQATICFDQALEFIHQSETLTTWSEGWTSGNLRQRVVPHLGSLMMVLPAKDPAALQGWTPTFAVVDEMGFTPDAVWSAMQQASAKRQESRVFGISTPGLDRNGAMFRLRALAREQKPRGLVYLEWAAPEGCALTDRRAWRQANPGIAAGIKPGGARMSELATTSVEDDFRRYQLGQWSGRSSHWLPWQAWGKLGRVGPPLAGEQVALGFDGSASGDATALCWATKEAVGVVQVWERIGEPGWRVPREQVVESVLAAFERWQVRMLACDEAGWRSELEEIERNVGARVKRVRFSQYTEFAPACDRFYQAIMAGQLATDGSEVLTRHLSNAVPVATPRGTAIAKSYPSSKDRIDAAVAAILAYEWAARLLSSPKQIDVRMVIG